jgi:hypothetical protein
MNQIDYKLIMAAQPGPTPNEYAAGRMSLQSMANKNRADELAYNQQLNKYEQDKIAQQRQIAIQQRLRAPDAIDPNTGYVSNAALIDISSIDRMAAQEMMKGQADIIKSMATAREQQALADLNARKQITEEYEAHNKLLEGAKLQKGLSDWEYGDLGKEANTIDMNNPNEAFEKYYELGDRAKNYITVDKDLFKPRGQATLEDVARAKDFIIRRTTIDKDNHDRMIADAEIAIKKKKNEIDMMDAITRRMGLGQKTDGGTVPKTAGGLKIQHLAQSQQDRMTQIFNTAYTIDKMQPYITSISELKRGPITGRILGKNPYDADFKVLDNLVNQIVPSMARGIFGEVGVLTDTDAERYKAMLPQAKDDPKVAAVIYDEIRDKIDSAYKITYNSYSKTRDVSGYDYPNVYAGAREMRGIVEKPEVTKETAQPKVLSFDEIVKKHQGGAK